MVPNLPNLNHPADRADHFQVSQSVAADSGGIVVGWLVKVVLVLAVVAIIIFDLVAVAYGRVVAADDARSIASAASTAMIANHATPADALELAVERAESRGIHVGKGDIVISKAGVVTVHVHRSITTLVMYRIGPLAQFGEVDETYSSPPLKNSSLPLKK